MDDPVNGAF